MWNWWNLSWWQLIVCVSNHINELQQVPKRKNFGFILIYSKVTAQTRWIVSILLWSIASRHITQQKKCNDFWLFGAKSFPTVYVMNDFAATVFSRYYTLKYLTVWMFMNMIYLHVVSKGHWKVWDSDFVTLDIILNVWWSNQPKAGSLY